MLILEHGSQSGNEVVRIHNTLADARLYPHRITLYFLMSLCVGTRGVGEFNNSNVVSICGT